MKRPRSWTTWPISVDRAVQVLEKLSTPRAQRDDPVQGLTLRVRGSAIRLAFLDAAKSSSCFGSSFSCSGRFLPQAFQNSWAPMWSRLATLGQVPVSDLAGQPGISVSVDALEAAPGSERMDLPYAARHHGLRRASVGMFDG
jgi:hypothetical protein